MKTVMVAPGERDGEVRRWLSRGLVVESTTPTVTVLARPPRQPRTFWRAVKLTIFTVGLYPILVGLWWLLLAWWVRPVVAVTRVDRVAVQVSQPG